MALLRGPVGRAMNIPQFTNPHCLHEHQTVTVSRSTLFPRSHHSVVDDDKLAELDELLKASLGDLELSRTRKRKRQTSTIEEQPSLIEASEPARKSSAPC